MSNETVEVESSLVAHARSELQIAGWFDKDADYGGLVGKAAMEIVTLFDKQGHSSVSAYLIATIVNKLVRYENLTPLTDNPDEWFDHGEDNDWQSKRNAAAFSSDGGVTYHLVGDRELKKYKTLSYELIYKGRQYTDTKESDVLD